VTSPRREVSAGGASQAGTPNALYSPDDNEIRPEHGGGDGGGGGVGGGM